MSRRAQKGSALIYTLVSVAVLSMFTSIIYDRVFSLMKSSRDWMWKERARAAAESGVEAARAKLLDDPLWKSGEGGGAVSMMFSLDGADVEVRTERFRTPDVIWIFSSGKYLREKKETIQPVMLADPTLFAVLARRGVNMGPGSIVTGAVAGARVKVEEGAEVVGSIISSGDLAVAVEQSEALVFDSVSSPPPVPEIRAKDLSAWKEPYPSDSPPTRGLYLHTGDLTLKDIALSGVSIRVTGKLTLDGNVKLELREDTPVLVVGGILAGTLKGSNLKGVIYVQGKADLKGEGLITGTLIADDIRISDGVVLQAFAAVSNAPRPPSDFWKRRIRRIRN